MKSSTSVPRTRRRAGVLQGVLVGPLWEGYRVSRRCSRDTYPESYITKYASMRRPPLILMAQISEGQNSTPYQCKGSRGQPPIMMAQISEGEISKRYRFKGSRSRPSIVMAQVSSGWKQKKIPVQGYQWSFVDSDGADINPCTWRPCWW